MDVQHSFEKKNETATMFFLKITFSSLVESVAHVN